MLNSIKLKHSKNHSLILNAAFKTSVKTHLEGAIIFIHLFYLKAKYMH